MKLAIRILLIILSVVFLATTVYTFFFLYPHELASAEASGDKLGYALTLPFILTFYALAVFCEVELFFGLKHLLSNIPRKSTTRIILSSLMICSVLMEAILGVLFATGSFIYYYLWWSELALFIIPIFTVALHIILLSMSIVSKIRRS